jgi:hypothetical protein
MTWAIVPVAMYDYPKTNYFFRLYVYCISRNDFEMMH